MNIALSTRCGQYTVPTIVELHITRQNITRIEDMHAARLILLVFLVFPFYQGAFYIETLGFPEFSSPFF